MTTNDVLTLRFFDSGLPGGTQAISYTVQGGDTLASIASSLASGINGNANLQAIAVSATASGSRITIHSSSVDLTSYRKSLSTNATETIALAPKRTSTQTAVVSGSVTTNDVLTLTAFDGGLPGGNKSVNYIAPSKAWKRGIST